MARIVTNEEIADVIGYIDNYFKSNFNTSIEEIVKNNRNSSNISRIILLRAFSNNYLAKLLNDDDLYYAILNYLEEYSKKILLSISNETLEISSRSSKYLSEQEFNMAREELDRLFEALEHNIRLYEINYKDKVWVVNSSIGRKARIVITPDRFFHLMGFVEREIRGEHLSTFESVFNRSDDIRYHMCDDKDLLYILLKMIERQDRIKDAIEDGTLRGIINPRKVEMKNFAFERVGDFRHSSGMVFFDRDLALRLGYKTNLRTELLLLSAFIRMYHLEFIFTGFRQYDSDPNCKNGETVVIPRRPYLDSMFLDQQLVSISERASRYPIRNFDFSVSEEEIGSEPDDEIIYSDADKLRAIASLLRNSHGLDTSHLMSYVGISTERSKKR